MYQISSPEYVQEDGYGYRMPDYKPCSMDDYSELNSWEDIVELAFDDDDCVAGLRSDGKVLLAGNCPYSVSDWDLID